MPTTVSWTPAIVLIALVIVAGIGASAYLYQRGAPQGPPHPLLTQIGDNVTVNYIGIMGSGPQAGKVFDTSIYAVASDPIGYPKTLEFGLRGAAENYTPLAVHVGGSTPSSGYSLGGQNFIQVVTGFWQGLVGLSGNVSRSVNVPPDLGYGPTRAACLDVKPLTFSVPIVETLTLNAFGTRYSGVTATQGAQFADPTYGWPVLVMSSNASYATVENLATVGWITHAQGYNEIVRSVTSTANGTGSITLEVQLTTADAGHVLGAAASAPAGCQSSGRYIISAVDLGTGTFTEDFDTEVTGQTLIFIVTVVDIFPPGTGGAAAVA